MNKVRDFILSLQRQDGGLKTSPSGKVNFNNAILMENLLQLGMDDVAKRFRKYLIEHQNDDGGWGVNEGNPSNVLASACVVKGLLSAGVDSKSEVIQKAADFLINHQNFDMGFSDQKGYKESIGWITAIVTEAILMSGFPRSSPKIDEAQHFARKCFWEYKDDIEKQLISIKSLKNSNFKVTIEVRELKLRIDRLGFSEDGGFPSENPCITTTIQIADFLYRNNFRNSPIFDKTINFIISNRNDDGGWPKYPGEDSLLEPTLEAAVLLKELGVMKEF